MYNKVTNQKSSLGVIKASLMLFIAFLCFSTISAQSVIYSTTNVATNGVEISAAANGPATSMGDNITVGGQTRFISKVKIRIFTLASTAPFSLTMAMYSDCSTSGASGPCGSGSALLPNSTVTVSNITPTATGAITEVTFNFPTKVDISGETDNTINISVNASRPDVFWVLGENVVVGSQPAGEPATSFVTRCGSVVGNNGCTRNFGIQNNFSMEVTADAVASGNCVPATFTSQPANQSVSCGNTATFTVNTTGTIPSFQWQYRVDSSSAWLNVPATPPYSGVNTKTLTISPVDASMNKYQYRVLLTGFCSAANPSTGATLTVTALALAVTPGTITKCRTAAAVLIKAPSTQTVVNFTNSTPGLVADGDLTGITRNVTVTGVTGPVQKIRVKVNAKSDYIGDLVISLKAPNGQTINVDYLLNKTNDGPSTGGGFVNTFFNLYRTVQNNPATNVPSSQSIDNFSSPYTGEFPIDNQQATFYNGVPSGPTGFAANTTNPASLTPTAASANGVWTLAMYDAGPPDPATFQNFTLEITFGGAPATITITPSTGLFTDSTGTTPYTGNAVTQVYANPTVTTTYNTTISAGTCSTTQKITVNVSSPATAVGAVANKSVCVGNNTTFTSSVTGGSNTTKNWQVRSDTSATFSNLTNGGVYSGVNTDTLKITGATLAMNGFRYRLAVSAGPCSDTTTRFSTVGTLTVNPTPVVTLSSPTTAIFPGLTTSLSVNVSPNAGATYTYFRDGVIVAGANGNTLTNINVDRLGSYSVRVTDVNGCVGTSNTIVLRDSANTELFIYPNPNNGSFQVRYFNSVDNPFSGTTRNLVVYDSKGARVYTQAAIITPSTFGAMNINLTNQPAGVYHVELVDGRGNRLKTAKIVIL